ncbi:hypothetical protein QBC41DRAFT_283428 [Cercophora samala]|uniref:Uncharacterized protein n=1 Tax=Cercophora samala TaxID=330535 RepID=A0AA40D6P6_9PEZI|nr:hypothetical protein QBC41DRAFT_283428 [Cercophora samala]
MERPDKPLTPPDDRDRKRGRGDRDRGDRDRVDRDRVDRDRGDRDRGDRDRGDRDRGDRDRGDDKNRGDDRAPAGEAASYFSAAAPMTGPNGTIDPYPIVTDSYRPPQGPDSSYPPRHDYGRPPPGSNYPLPSHSTGISPNYPPGPGPNGASASYYGTGVVESMPGPAATSGVGMSYVPPAPLSGPPHHGALPIQSTTPLPLAVQSSFYKPTLKSMRQKAEKEVTELSSLQRQRKMIASKGTRRDYDEISDRIRIQTATVLAHLKNLRQEMIQIVEDAEDQRWRRWIVGTIFGTFIPLVKKLFRRPSSEKKSKTRTEYAFIKSKSLLGRILAATHGHRPGLTTVTFFVFAVLYIFSNEVSLRVAKTASKRLKKLVNKVENTSNGRDGDVLKDDDIKLLSGWRWRVLEFID